MPHIATPTQRCCFTSKNISRKGVHIRLASIQCHSHGRCALPQRAALGGPAGRVSHYSLVGLVSRVCLASSARLVLRVLKGGDIWTESNLQSFAVLAENRDTFARLETKPCDSREFRGHLGSEEETMNIIGASPFNQGHPFIAIWLDRWTTTVWKHRGQPQPRPLYLWLMSLVLCGALVSGLNTRTALFCLVGRSYFQTSSF